MTITKPIDLIVANVMHNGVAVLQKGDAILSLVKKIGGKVEMPDLNSEIARKLLCEISHDAHITKVFEALKAVGAPATLEDIAEGLRAVKERQS